MLEFYSKNVKYFFRMLYYKHIVLLAVVLPLIIIVSGGVLFFLSKVNWDLFTVVFFCILTALLFFGGAWVLWNFLFITVYSLLKEEQDDRIFTGILYRLYGSMTDKKILFVVFVLLLAAAGVSTLLYFYVVPDAGLYHLIKLAIIREIEFLITVFILFIIIERTLIWTIIVHFIEALGGILRVLFILALGLLALSLLVGLFWLVMLIFDPILNPILGISG